MIDSRARNGFLVAIRLFVECLLLGSFNRMLEQVIETTNTGRLPLLDQLFASAADQHRLHITLRLRQVEQFAAIRATPHLDESFGLAVTHIAQ